MKTAERHDNEIGPKIWSCENAGYCVVCHNPVLSGQEYFAIVNSTSRRHAGCAKTIKNKPKIGPKPSYIGKRRRTGGHGWSGGDGFKDI